MKYKKPFATALLILTSLVIAPNVRAEDPASFKISGVPRIKQMTNYCGPACLAAVLQYQGKNIAQDAIGKAVYDPTTGSTNGADMLIYARDNGLAAYSYNTSIEGVKRKISAGVPVIVLQQNSTKDSSGHYRVLTGFDDKLKKFNVMDPYYDNITEMTYSECERLWNRMGHWALLVMPKDKDHFKSELDEQNPVVHMDLSFAWFKHKNYADALQEANTALKLEPGNVFAKSLLRKIKSAMAAQAKQL